MNQSKGIEPFLEPLEALQRLLSRFNERGVIIGGAAVSILGRARYTEDIDAMFLLCKEGSSLAKFASFHETAEGVRFKSFASSMI